MNLIESIFKILREHNPEINEESHCPNCWGHQEFQGKFLDRLKEKRVDMNNIKEELGWVEEIAKKYVDGIKLEETEDYFECPNCKITYQKDKVDISKGQTPNS